MSDKRIYHFVDGGTEYTTVAASEAEARSNLYPPPKHDPFLVLVEDITPKERSLNPLDNTEVRERYTTDALREASIYLWHIHMMERTKDWGGKARRDAYYGQAASHLEFLTKVGPRFDNDEEFESIVTELNQRIMPARYILNVESVSKEMMDSIITRLHWRVGTD